MTVRLYENDPYCSCFDAKVVGIDGDWIALDGTYFYPGGGGQEPDLGTIEGMAVAEVKADKESVKHRVPRHTFTNGQAVHCEIDWERRYDLMKGHSGEHLLYGSIQKMLDELELVKISITPEKKMVMVRGHIDWGIIMASQRAVNEVIAKGILSEEVWVGRDSPLLEKARVKLERIHGDRVRLVSFGDYDIAACSGIHVKNTSEIGMLLVTKFTSAKPVGDYEIEFEVGNKATLKALELSSLALQASSSMGATTDTLLGAISNQGEELRMSKDALKKYARQALARIVPETIDGMRVYSGVFEGVDKKVLMDAANSITRESTSLCAFATEGDKLTLVVASSPDLGIDCSVVLNDVLKRVSGKGGGNRTFATGGAQVCGQSEVLVGDVVETVRRCRKV
ncbi:MAG TPA: DHHA1 domain-containing protein [Methanomassiliicoccales archaeon]|jgi:alanyl-tRNA synthetase